MLEKKPLGRLVLTGASLARDQPSELIESRNELEAIVVLYGRIARARKIDASLGKRAAKAASREQ